MYDWYQRLLAFAALLALTVIVVGAYVRLTDAGLGCPDWPGCYGELVLPADPERLESAQAAFPERELDTGKAWREMFHRYIASTLGLSIVFIAGLAWFNRRDKRQPVVLPQILLGTVIFQGLLGMWTVTLLLKPVIVMAHLLGGLATLGILAWLLLDAWRNGKRSDRQTPRHPAARYAVIGCVVLLCQIALGGWTSANYAALACPDLPTCLGQWWPEQADFAEGFVMWRGLGIDYEGGVLEAPARVAIHFTHRLGAMVTLLVLGGIALYAWRTGGTRLKVAAAAVIAMLLTQVSVGAGIVWFGLPLPLATAHNGVAAVLLLATLNLIHAARRAPPPLSASAPTREAAPA